MEIVIRFLCFIRMSAVGAEHISGRNLFQTIDMVLRTHNPATLTIWPWIFLCYFPGLTAVTCSSAKADLLSLVSKQSKMQPQVFNWYKQTGTHYPILRFPFNYFYSLISLVPPSELLSRTWSSSLHCLDVLSYTPVLSIFWYLQLCFPVVYWVFLLCLIMTELDTGGAGVSKKGPGALVLPMPRVFSLGTLASSHSPKKSI